MGFKNMKTNFTFTDLSLFNFFNTFHHYFFSYSVMYSR